MAEEPYSLVLQMPRSIWATLDRHSARFDDSEARVNEAELAVVSLDLRLDALDERVEMVREGAESAIRCAANGHRGGLDPQKQVADLTRRLGKLEAGR